MSDLQPLGSLAQANRSKQLKAARWILIIVGTLSVLLNGYYLVSAQSLVDAEVEKQTRGQGNVIIDQEAVDQVVRMVQVASGVGVALAIALIICGVMVYKAPVPATITGLVIYIGGIAGTAMLDPDTIKRGIILKVIIIICLVKAVQAAIAYQKEAVQPQPGPMPPGEPPAPVA